MKTDNEWPGSDEKTERVLNRKRSLFEPVNPFWEVVTRGIKTLLNSFSFRVRLAFLLRHRQRAISWLDIKEDLTSITNLQTRRPKKS